MSVKEALSYLKTDEKEGLSLKEAEERLRKNGKNTLEAKNKDNFFKKFIRQFKDFMIITLIVSAIISFAISYFNHDGDILDPVIILSIVFLNAIIGVIQESRAESAIAALKRLTEPTVLCIREGKKVRIPSENIVVGDILILNTGDMVCADCRIVYSKGLLCNESSLTGESLATEKRFDVILDKETHLAERENCLYSSCVITEGYALAVVFATGMETQVGLLASAVNTEEVKETPLQKKLSGLGKVLALGALFCCLFVFVAGTMRNYDPFFMFMTSVSLAVAAIPEGLPAIVTVILAMSVSKMAKKRAIVRNLPAVETLGSATVICSDKTGTLTENKMTLKDITGDKNETLELMCIASTSDGENGNVTENAIIKGFGKDKRELDKKYRRIDEIPFTSERKRSVSVHEYDERYITIVKGAFDVILPMCTKIKDGGGEKSLDEKDKKRQIELCSSMASKGLRVIAVAKKIGVSPSLSEEGLTFVGMVSLEDPLRVEVVEAVKTCKRAGIEVVIITGDHKDTALYIASKIGLHKGGAITGAELSSMSDAQLKQALLKTRVFARVLPEHKVRIVKALKNMGHIVAMTGDGVNDSPALKAADIGCAMGKSGTDAARQASDMVLTDDNFATIVEAVKEGRIIYGNIKKSVHFLISSNIGEILLMLMGILTGMGAPLFPIQLLWVNLITDSLPALALGADKCDNDVMEKKAESHKKGLFSDGLWVDIITEGLLIGTIGLAAYAYGRYTIGGGEALGSTMAFCTLSISQLVHAFNVRSEKSVFLEKNQNIWLFMSFVIGVFLQCTALINPVLRTVFKTVKLEGKQWMIVCLFSVVPLVVCEIGKMINRFQLTKDRKWDIIRKK